MVAENVEGINTVNGHSYADPSLRSENTNFALLVSNRFTQPFNEPYRYGKHIASLSNMLAGGVLVQRFGDLVKGVRTNEHRLGKSFTRPTLTAAVPGDLSLALPKRQLDDIIEMIYVLDKIAPGTANHDTLLYGAEVKFYSARLQLTPGAGDRHPPTSLPPATARASPAAWPRLAPPASRQPGPSSSDWIDLPLLSPGLWESEGRRTPVRRPSCIFSTIFYVRPSSGGALPPHPSLLLSKVPNRKTDRDLAAKHRASQWLSTLSTEFSTYCYVNS